MRTYVKTQKNGQQKLVYALIQLKDKYLVLTSSNGLLKTFKRRIDLTKIGYLGQDQYYGGNRIIFGYEDEQYAIFENGPAVITDLHNQLSLIREVKNYGKYPRYC